MKIDIAKQLSESKVGDKFVMSNREVWEVTDCDVSGKDEQRKLRDPAHIFWLWFYASDGGKSNIHTACEPDPTIICRYVEPTPVLDFPLEAGKKYNTVKPDGTPGPVVGLCDPNWSPHRNKVINAAIPLMVMNGNLYVTRWGEVIDENGKTVCRITSPYTEPKPPTIAERIRRWYDAGCGSETIHDLIKAVEQLEAKQ